MKRTSWMLICWLAAMGLARADATSDRINAAIPLPRAVQLAWMTLSSMTLSPGDRRALQSGYNTQLEIRGLACAPLFKPSRGTTNKEIAARLAGTECMEKADAAVASWISSRRVEFLLKMPPLRPPLRVAPPAISGNYIQDTRFAPAAGVGLIWSNQHLEIVDLKNGSRIFTADNFRAGYPFAFSPNGRLLALNSPAGVVLMDVEAGDIIATLFARLDGFSWIANRDAIFADASGSGIMLKDFHSDTKRKVNFLPMWIHNVAALPQNSGTFIAFTDKNVMLLKLDSSGAEPQVRLISEKPFPFRNAFRYPGLLSSDGSYYISLNGEIAITDTRTLETEIISLDPYSIDRATVMSKGDEFLLGGGLPRSNNGIDFFVYSATRHTVERVDRQQLMADQVAYLPSAHSFACISKFNIQFQERIPLGTAIPVSDFSDLIERELDAKAGAK